MRTLTKLRQDMAAVSIIIEVHITFRPTVKMLTSVQWSKMAYFWTNKMKSIKNLTNLIIKKAKYSKIIKFHHFWVIITLKLVLIIIIILSKIFIKITSFKIIILGLVIKKIWATMAVPFLILPIIIIIITYPRWISASWLD